MEPPNCCLVTKIFLKYEGLGSQNSLQLLAITKIRKLAIHISYGYPTHEGLGVLPLHQSGRITPTLVADAFRIFPK